MIETVDVLGLGNALVDIIAYADDDYLDAHEMAKGAMTLIDEDRAEALYAARVDPRIVSGGSAANTIVGVASFGVRSAYIGKVKNDELGYAYAEDIRAAGVGFAARPAEDGPATGRCFVYVTPDGERTMNTYLGASTHLAPPDVDADLVGLDPGIGVEPPRGLGQDRATTAPRAGTGHGGIRLTGTRLTEPRLTGIRLTGTRLTGPRFSGPRLADAVQSERRTGHAHHPSRPRGSSMRDQYAIRM